jgi:hypothetical protein
VCYVMEGGDRWGALLRALSRSRIRVAPLRLKNYISSAIFVFGFNPPKTIIILPLQSCLDPRRTSSL